MIIILLFCWTAADYQEQLSKSSRNVDTPRVLQMRLLHQRAHRQTIRYWRQHRPVRRLLWRALRQTMHTLSNANNRYKTHIFIKYY